MGLLVAVIAVLLIIYLATVSPGFRIVLLVVLAAALPLAYLWYLQSEKQSADNESRLTIARSSVKPTDTPKRQPIRTRLRRPIRD